MKLQELRFPKKTIKIKKGINHEAIIYLALARTDVLTPVLTGTKTEIKPGRYTLS